MLTTALRRSSVAIALTVLAIMLTVMTALAQVGAITNIVVDATGAAGEATVSWDEVEEARDYRVSWSEADENFKTWSDPTGNAFPTTNSYTITGLNLGTQYKVKIRARFSEPQNGANSGPWSEEVTFIGEPEVALQQMDTDATLSAFTVSPKDINGFTPDQEQYQVGVASTVTTATIAATPNDAGATVEITPPDADTVAPGHQVTLSAGSNIVRIKVTAEDTTTTKTYSANVARGVTTDFGWKAVDDFDTLVAAGARNPQGIWSDGTTMWVADSFDDKVYAFTLATKARDSSREFDLHSDNGAARGIWSDGTTIWVNDGLDDKLYAYALSDGARQASRDIDLTSGHDDPKGIWSDGTTIWVVDDLDDKLYAYVLSNGDRQASRDIDLHSDNGDAFGVWSDGATIWVGDIDDTKLYAYALSGGARDATQDFNTLSAAGNQNLAGLWSDGVTMWVSDNGKIFSYNVPLYPPGAPTGLTAEAFGTRRIELSWTAPDYEGTYPISGYRIQWSADGTTDWQDLRSNTGRTDTEYRDSGHAPQTTRHYRVAAISDAGTGDFSNVADATTDAKVSIGLTQDTVTENSGLLSICLRANPEPTVEVRVQYATRSGTALAGEDFRSRSGTLVFGPGKFLDCASIPIIDDSRLELTETFSVELTLLDTEEADLGTGVTTVEIPDNDTAVARLVPPSSVTEGRDASFEVTLSNPAAYNVQVDYRTIAGTATSGSDFTATSGTLTFLPGVTSRSFNVPIHIDTDEDPGETFDVRIAFTPGQIFGAAIQLEDDRATLSIEDVQGPPGLTATPGTRQVTLNWTNPQDNSITAYQYRVSDSGGSTWDPDWTNVPRSGPSTTSYVVRGLTAGIAHEIQLRMLRGTEQSPHASVRSTPEGPSVVPLAPRDLSVYGRNGGLFVSWKVPFEDSRAPVTSYRVQHRRAGTSGSWTTISHARSNFHETLEITSLTNRQHYEVRVAAVNRLGTGSAASANGTPQGPVAVEPPPPPPSHTELPRFSLGTPGAYWTDRFGSDTIHPDSTATNTIENSCTGTHSFKVYWEGPSINEDSDNNMPAAEYEAHIITREGAGNVTHTFRDEFGNEDFVGMYGSVDLLGYSSLTVRVRGRYSATQWGEWSPLVGLMCLPED